MADRRPFLFLGLGLVGYSLWQIVNPPKAKPPPPPPPPQPPGGGPPPPSPSPGGCQATYVVRSGDTLWAIAARYYGNGALYPRIYAANSVQIEAVARAHGFSSSQLGHWIFPGESLCIP